MSGIEVLSVGEGTKAYSNKDMDSIKVVGELSLALGAHGVTKDAALRGCSVGIRHKDGEEHTLRATFDGVGSVLIGCNGTVATFTVALDGASRCLVTIDREGLREREEEIGNGESVTVSHGGQIDGDEVVRVEFALGAERAGVWSAAVTHAPYTVTVTSDVPGAPTAGTAALTLHATGLAGFALEGAGFTVAGE